jgi:hypothetical protein
MFRIMAIAVGAYAAIDLYLLDGKYTNAVRVMGHGLFHHFFP